MSQPTNCQFCNAKDVSCGTVKTKDYRLRSPLCIEREARQRVEAELAEVTIKLEVNETLAVGLQRMLGKEESKAEKLRALMERALPLMVEAMAEEIRKELDAL